MKTAIICLTLFVVATSVYCNKAIQMKNLEECKTEVGITDELKAGQTPDYNNEKVKCFYTCISKKSGNMKDDGKIIAWKYVEIYKKHKFNKSDVEDCVKKANEQSGCEVIYAFLNCMVQVGSKVKYE